MTNFAPCRWRTGDICRSPKLSGGRVTPSLCAGCYCRDHEPTGAMPMEPPAPPPVCRRRGDDPVPAYVAARRGMSPLKLWYECAVGVNGGLVCMCQNACGPSCEYYLAPATVEIS